jgi:hypothetical protein
MLERPVRLDWWDFFGMDGLVAKQKVAWIRPIAYAHLGGIFCRMTNPVESTIALLEQMITQQESKVLTLGRKWVPFATAEDLRNAEDFAILKDKPIFHFEDGILAGLIAANTALKAELRSMNSP